MLYKNNGRMTGRQKAGCFQLNPVGNPASRTLHNSYTKGKQNPDFFYFLNLHMCKIYTIRIINGFVSILRRQELFPATGPFL